MVFSQRIEKQRENSETFRLFRYFRLFRILSFHPKIPN